MIWYRILCQQSVLIKDKCEEKTTVDPKVEDLRKEISSLKSPCKLTADVAEKIRILWDDEGIQNTLKNRCKFQIHDNVHYFLDSVERVADPQYKPTWEDYVRIRMRSTGFSQTRLTTDVAHLGKHHFEFTGNPLSFPLSVFRHYCVEKHSCSALRCPL